MLTVASIPLQMVSFRRKEDRFRGERVTAFNNSLLDGTDLPLEEYEGTTIGMTKEAAAALRAAVSAGPVVCSGALLDTSPLTCEVTIGDAPRERVGNTSFEVQLSLVLRQQG